MLNTITYSKKRENLLIFLRDGPKTLEEIRSSLKVTSSGMIPQIRKLEEQNLVNQEGKNYRLTDTGLIIADAFCSFIKTIEVIEKHMDFWVSHDLRAIPKHLLGRINELENCHLIESKISETYEPHMEFFENVSRSKKIRGISPVFHPSYPSFFSHLVKSGKEVSLILTRDVFNKVKNEYREMLETSLSVPTARLYVSDDDIRITSAVTDSFFTISLFFKNGSYDHQRDLVSFEGASIKWGEELFNHFLTKSKEIKSL